MVSIGTICKGSEQAKIPISKEVKNCTRADLGFFFLLGLEPVMTTRYFVGRIRYSFENWVKKKVIRGESKSGRKESLFPKEATHKGWQNPLIQPRVLESLKN